MRRPLDPFRQIVTPLCRLAAYGYIVHQAALDGGRLDTSTRALGATFGWSEARVRRFLRALQGDALIDAESGASGTLICLRHQRLAKTIAANATQESTRPAQTTIKGSPHGQEHPKRGSRLPAAWAPDLELLAFARTLGLSDERVRRETEQFRDYYRAATGTRATKRDWSAAYRNWMRKALDYSGAGRNGVHRRRHDLAGAAETAVAYHRAQAERW